MPVEVFRKQLKDFVWYEGLVWYEANSPLKKKEENFPLLKWQENTESNFKKGT